MITIYKASAGSGKTFNLARRYLTLLLGLRRDDGSYELVRNGRNRHRTVLAITFTNKATEEMKSRIIHELAVLAGREPGWTEKSPHKDYLMELFGCGEDALGAAARNALDDLLVDFNFFNVSTIDSFFQTVLRTFAREAEIDGNYEVELDDKMVIGLGVGELLQSLNLGGADDRDSRYLIEWLRIFMIGKVEEGKSFNIFNRSTGLHDNLVKFFGDISNETFDEHRSEIMDYLEDPERLLEFDRRLRERSLLLKNEIFTSCSRVVQMMADGLPDKGFFNRYLKGQMEKWSRGIDSKGPAATVTSIYNDIEAAYSTSGAGSPLRTPELDDAISRACSAIVDNCKEIKFLGILTRNLFQLGLLRRLNEAVDRFRAENSTILLSDTNAILNRIIGEDDTPFVYERIGGRLDNFLIDEFQDTSALQWANLRPLVEESLSRDNDNLVIGDEKQCIYRFRNSEPRLLQELHTGFPGRYEHSGMNPKENTNWRSSADVVRFNNTLFMAIAEQTGLQKLYGNVAQLVSPKHRNHRGYVKIKDFAGSDAANKQQLLPEMLEFMTAELQRAIDDGYSPADIGILVRTRKEGAAVINHLLALQTDEGRFPGMRFVSDQSILVSQSATVRLIVSVLRFLVSTDETSSPRKKSRREIARLLNRFEFFRSRNLSPSDALVEALGSREPIEEIAGEAVAVRCLNLPTVVERIIARYIPTDMRRSDNLFICSFLDMVTDFVRNGQGDIQSFLRWWDDKGCRRPVAGVADADTLSVLTIHKAKGLEYKVVIIPFAGDKALEVDEVKWFRTPAIKGIEPGIIPPYLPVKCSSSLESTPFADEYSALLREVTVDELNVLYVALTRAVDRLVIALPKTDANSVAEIIRKAVARCDSSYAARLGEVCHMDDWSSFMPMAMNGDELEIGEMTAPWTDGEGDKPLTALEPKSTDEMRPYHGDDRDDLWAATKVDSDRRLNFGEARSRGIILHDLLSKVVRRTDVDRVLYKMTRDGYIPADEAEETARHIRTLLADERAALWFDGTRRVMCERPILDHDSELRPDRVVWTAAGTVDVIDYKSGAERPARYAAQVRGYMAQLRKLGYENVRGFLWYLDTGEIVSC